MADLSVRLLAVMALLLLAGCHPVQTIDSGAVSAQLVIDPATLDLGEVDGSKPIHANLLIRNVSEQPAIIAHLISSCGCTDLRADAMALPVGGFTPLHVTIDPFAKQGMITKTVTVKDGLGGESRATIRFHLRANPHASASKRSLFDGSCASCHAHPAKGVYQGEALYQAVCAMCHGADGDGGYAPKLRGLKADALLAIITHGAGSPAMPAFGQAEGGPLSKEQIRALVEWLR